MHYQRNQFFSIKKKQNNTVTFLRDDIDKIKDKSKADILSHQEIELEVKKDRGEDDVEEGEEEQHKTEEDEKSTSKLDKDNHKKKEKKPHTTPEQVKIVKEFNKSLDSNSLLRRWDVKFLDIQVENLQKEAINIFLVFKIGEKTQLNEDDNKNGGKAQKDPDIVENRKSYKQFKTEIIKELEKESKRKIKLFIETEIHASYNMLRQRSIVVEVWEYSRWKLNNFLGVYQIKLETIAAGSINQQFDIKRAGVKASFLRLFFKCYFQEIWDFRLDFENLKGFNTIDQQRKPIASYLKLTLMDESKSSLKSSDHKETLNPNWGYIQDYIHFRGTLDDLTDNLLQVALIQANPLAILNEDQKTLITLRGIHKFNSLQATIKVKVNKQKSKKKEKTNEIMSTEEQEEEKLEQLNEEEVYTYIEGRVNLNQIPRYIQQGELVRYKKDQHHLCIVINRVSHISAPDDRGLINSYVVIQCGNEMKQTRTVKDQMNPDFNEEMVFKIPISKSSSIFDQVKGNNIVVEQMRDELAKRNEVRFSLWVEGNQITSDDNLGYASFNISELLQADQIEEKEVIDFETKKRIKHKIKVGNFTKNFISSRFDASRITISFLAFFLPMLPDAVDLRDFSKMQSDIYPYDIRDKMKVHNNNYQQNILFLRWEQKIKETFKQWNLKKNEIAIFLKNIWIKDHYNKIHFICKYVDSFSIQDMSYEDTDETEKLDTVLETMQDLAHYARCIPFVESDYNDIWYSPDFFLSLRRGSAIDHALLMGCLFMGSGHLKKTKEELKQEEFPIEDRVFICLGTNQHEYIVAWVMVFEKDFTAVSFWDVKENKKWVLKNRVDESQIHQLKVFLNPSIKDEKKSKLGLFGFKNKKEKELEKKMKEEQKRLDEQKRKEEEEKQEQIRLQQEQDKQEMLNQQQDLQKVIQNINKEPKNDNKQNPGFISLINKDDTKRNHIFTIDEIENGNQRRNQVKQLAEVSAQSNPTITIKEPPKKGQQNDTQLQNQINERKTFLQAQNDINQPKKSFLDAHKENMIKEQDLGELTKFKKIEEFGDEPGEFDELPYKSIQVIFNHKNVYANLCNQNPTAIFYHLHEQKKWFPYLENNNQKLGSFYLPSNPYPKMSKVAADDALEKILSDVKDSVSKMRSNASLTTQWKSVLDPTSKLLKHYVRCLEYKDKERKMQVIDPKDKKTKIYMEFEELKVQFEKDMKNLMPVDYHFQCLPMKFLFIEKSQIRALIEEKTKQFFTLKKKNIIFGVNGKIFRYQNKINCLRIVIAMYYSDLDNVQTDKGNENANKDENEIMEEDEEHFDLLDSDDQIEEQQENLNQKKSTKKSTKSKK